MPRLRADVVDRARFLDDFRADVVAMPRNVCLIGWDAGRRRWAVAGSEPALRSERVPLVVDFLTSSMQVWERSWWLLCCTFDGWRERVPPAPVNHRVPATVELDAMDEWRGSPGVLPVLSVRQPWVACFCRQVGDESAVLLPEAHYLKFGGYRALFRSVSLQRPPWRLRSSRGVFAGGDHGDVVVAGDGRSSRRALLDVVRAAGLPVDVTLGGSIGRRRQLGYRYLLDVDGFVRTFDAWAWKLASGSVVLSQASHWQTMFTDAFTAWEHYIPVARDFSDLGDRLEWCLTHDAECRAMAMRARRRAYEVYDPDRVRERSRVTLTSALFGERG